MDRLVCPHCDSTVSSRAHVCVGCGAEIVRGATRAERRRLASIFGFLAFLIGLFYIGASNPPDPRSDAALFLVFGFLVFILFSSLVGSALARILYSKKPRFVREYSAR